MPEDPSAARYPDGGEATIINFAFLVRAERGQDPVHYSRRKTKKNNPTSSF
jgi:hypothetical protein